jgi:hypothetical protein
MREPLMARFYFPFYRHLSVLDLGTIDRGISQGLYLACARGC